MKFLVIFSFLALASANLKFIKKESNFEVLENSLDSRLDGGSNALDTQFPYVAELNVRWRNGALDTCSGSLLSTTYVITARECIFDDTLLQNAATVMILLGSASRASQRTAIFIQWATWLDRVDGQGPHPNFGLTLLSQPAVLSLTIQTVRLPTFAQSNDWFSMRSAWIAGWGETRGAWADALQFGRTTITPREAHDPNLVPGLTEYEFVAQRGSEFPALVLTYGDQGGPMVIEETDAHTIIGVLWTNRNLVSGPTTAPMITAFRVGHFWDFIHDVTGIPRRW